ncbi:hypothetical protein SAMN04488056_104397 [Cohaesibacter marisflavi]|uniref:Uncharacterized protein n=1 Tax=Cohaesibacter marisflavi TaxID=655353 RepID=A0A1I5G8D2_9HYPH|nr:hypothetical protein SAMN04488056_104397 [Cohaesibacter marisflavi]
MVGDSFLHFWFDLHLVTRPESKLCVRLRTERKNVLESFGPPNTAT